MDDHDGWKNLPIELLKLISARLKFLVDFRSFTAVCKSWKSAASELKDDDDKPWLPFLYHPWLLLAEDPGADLSSVKVSYLDAAVPMHDNFNAAGQVFGDDQTRRIDRIIDDSINNLFTNISSIRGLFSLATQNIYNLDLPEATDKLILGANKGWLLTLGRDLEINLLHPLLREQIPLPPMLTLPSHDYYDDDFFPQKVYTMFISKVAMSSEVPRKGALQHHDTGYLPVIMIIYGMNDTLGFARLGDKFWTNVLTSARWFHDIIYHREKFYAIDSKGAIFRCDKKEQQYKATQIASVPVEIENHVQSYIVESLSRSHIWVVLRFRKGVLYETGPLNCGDFWYYTFNFKIFKFEATPTCTCTQEVKDLGNEALFIGRGSSISLEESSKFIQPNSIYFTDDSEFLCNGRGSHDMGIFNVKTGEIQPHFKGMSIHPFSPPLWYI